MNTGTPIMSYDEQQRLGFAPWTSFHPGKNDTKNLNWDNSSKCCNVPGAPLTTLASSYVSTSSHAFPTAGHSTLGIIANATTSSSPSTVSSLGVSSNEHSNKSALAPSSSLLLRTLNDGTEWSAARASSNKRQRTQGPSSDIPSVEPLKKKRKPEGRKGDPRMHAAVSLRLGNPKMTLVDALVGGGFVFPTLGEPGATDRNTHDTDGALLYQRKNQLNRRLRLAKNKTKGGGSSIASKKGGNNGSSSSSSPSSSRNDDDEQQASSSPAMDTMSARQSSEEEEEEPRAIAPLHDIEVRHWSQRSQETMDEFLALLDKGGDNVLDRIFDDDKPAAPREEERTTNVLSSSSGDNNDDCNTGSRDEGQSLCQQAPNWLLEECQLY